MQQHAVSSPTTTTPLSSPSRALRLVPCAPSHDHPEYSIRRGHYNVHVARSPQHRMQAARLVERMYSWRGYRTADRSAPIPTASQATYVASAGTEVLGTLTLQLDDGENGLLADGLYGAEIREFRARGRKACELSKLAVSPEHSSKELLASLIQLAHVYARILNSVSDAFIEVNPRHAAFYQRMLGFRRIGAERTCERVGAPAVLLHLDLDYMDEQIRTQRSSQPSPGRSLYPYFVGWPSIDGLHEHAVQAA